MAPYAGMTDRTFVETLYRRVLGREPDAGGLAHMLARLRKGDDRLAIVQAFVDSDEFQRNQPLGPTFVPRGHFYSPFPSAEAIRAHRGFDWNRAELPGIDLNESGQMRLLEALASHYVDIPFAD